MGDAEIGLTGAVLWAVATIVCFGSQTVHLKLRVCRRAKAPWHLKFFFSLGTTLVGVITAAYVAIVSGKSPFNKWGAITALLWAPGTVCMLAATERIGVGLTIGLIAAISSIVACITGVTIMNNNMPRPLDAVLAMLLLVAGVATLATAAIIGKQRRVAARGPGLLSTACRTTIAVEASAMKSTTPDSGGQDAASPRPSRPMSVVVMDDQQEEDEDEDGNRTQIIGGSCAALTGILYGLQGIPIGYGADNPLGTGASMMLTQLLLMSCIVLVRLSTLEVEEGQNRWQPQGKLRPQSVLFSLLGGVLFGIGFVGQNFVLDDFGAAVGVPLTQANLVVAGLWGICAFREVQGVDLISVFSVGSALVLAGVALLAVLN